jgi:glycosyltransferase involved in cell wall biosynthesis
MKLRVCLIIPTLVQGGAEKQLTLLACNLPRELFEVHVLVLTYSGPLEQQLRAAGVEVHVVGKKAKIDPTSYFRLKKMLRQISPHVVHTWLFAANSYGRLAAAGCDVPVIVAGERCVDPWKAWWHYRIDRWLVRYTNCIATNTTAVTDFYTARGIPSELFEVIPNAIVPAAIRIAKAELFARLRIPPRKYVIGAVGRCWPQKGYPELLWAAELLRCVVKDIWLVIVGDGPDRERLQQLRDDYGAQDAVRFVGHRQDAGELLTAFDLLWNGSLYEGQSNTILEAMSAGVPVVASDIPGNRDLVEHGQTGFLYPRTQMDQLAKHSLQLITDPDLMSQFSARSRQLAQERFSLEAMVRSYTLLYQKLYESHQRSAAK